MARRRARILLLLASSAAAALLACNLLTGLDADYKLGLVDPGTEGGKDGDLPLDGPGADADGSIPTDAPTDRNPPRDAGVDSAFCDTIDAAFLDFCDDFEDPTLKGAGIPAAWTGKMSSVDASVKIIPGLGMDGSAALEVDTSSAGTASRQIWLHRSLAAAQGVPSQYLRIELDFDFRVDVSELNYEAVGVINFTGATPEDHGVAAYVGDLVARLNPPGTGVSNGGTWHHARITLVHAAKGTPFTSVITIDGASVDNTGNVPTTGTSLTEVRMGVFYTTNAAGRVHASFDNVVVRRFF